MQANIIYHELIPNYLLHSSQYAISIIDLEGNYVFTNHCFFDRYQENIDFVGKPFYITIHQDDVEVCNQAAYDCIKNPERIVSLNIRKPVINTVNSFYWTSWEFSAFKNKDSQIIGILCIGNDTTNEHNSLLEKQKYFNELKKSENKLRAILDSSISCNFFISPEYKILCFNKKARDFIREIYKKEVQENDDISLYIMQDVKEIFFANFSKALQGQATESEIKLSFPNRCTIWGKALYLPVYDSQCTVIGVSFNALDVTTQKEAEIKAYQQYELLKQIGWQQSHEVRGPIANILGLVNLLQNDKDASDDDVRLYLKYLQAATEKLDKIIHKIVESTNYLDEDN